jgi:hypothetical protein
VSRLSDTAVDDPVDDDPDDPAEPLAARRPVRRGVGALA